MDNDSVALKKPAGTGFTIYLLVTAAICGALVMVVEVLGSRVIGPYFGVSLFVWTALISVTLLSLSVGYALGGRLADRHPSPDWLFGLIVVAGLLVASVPVLKVPVIEATSVMGLRVGALAAATLLFAPALLILGCVSPYIVRVGVADWACLGRTVGLFYAVSTAGSFAGTALSGFFIIAYLGVTKAFYLCGFLLCALGVSYFAVFRGRVAAALALIPFGLVAFDQGATVVATMPDGTRVTLIDHGDSFYGNVKVVDYQGAAGQTREMMIDGLIQGGLDSVTGQSVYEYAYLMAQLPFAAKPDIKTALFIGLGPGAVVGEYQRRGVLSDVVDIDPLVVEMAEKHFGFRPQRPVMLADGRTALRDAKSIYDVIVMDVFNGDITPGHLLSAEAIAQARAKLSPDGVFAMNLIGSMAPNARMLPSVVRTLGTQFREVIAFPLFDASNLESARGNLVILASNVSLAGPLAVRELAGVHPLAALGVTAALRQGMRLPESPNAVLLTDDYNPLDVFEATLHEEVRKTILNTTPRAILLHG